MERENYKLKKYAEINEEPSLKEVKKWFGVYKGIRYEINQFQIMGRVTPSWTHYIWINIDQQLPENLKDLFWLKAKIHQFTPGGTKHLHYDYYVDPIKNIEFHGGCTWYSKESGFEGDDRIVKIGCDYQHLWDENKVYNLSYVTSEVKTTIESLINLCEGNIKIRSSGDGKYYYESEFE